MRAAYNARRRGTARGWTDYADDKKNWLASAAPNAHLEQRMVRIFISTARQLALKIASYGVMHLVVAILVAYALTRDWRLALAVGLVEPFFQTIAYSIHDRVWHRIERRGRLSGVEETAEAVTARLEVMSAEEQKRAGGGRAGHSHALPRSLKQVALKTVTYGVMHFTVAVLVALALTGDLITALAIGVVEPLVQTVFFTLHDRLWSRMETRRAAA